LTAPPPEGAPAGLWLQDPNGGAARLINPTIQAPAIGGGAAWGADFNRSDPSPAPGGIDGRPINQVDRLDLKTGIVDAWFYRPGALVNVAGFDNRGNPFVSVVRSSSPNDWSPNTVTLELWLVTSPAVATRVFAGPTNAPWPSNVAAIDDHGIWFDGGYAGTSERSVWLYSQNVIRMVAQPNLDYVNVAGGCLSFS
jgi:hypothetical protein